MDVEAKITGVIRDHRGRAIACPTCRETEGHLVYGKFGGTGRLFCRNAHRFPFPAGTDARAALAQALAASRR